VISADAIHYTLKLSDDGFVLLSDILQLSIVMLIRYPTQAPDNIACYLRA
jgi:hypothetical protein